MRPQPRSIRDLAKQLEAAGFQFRMGKGSHGVFKHPCGEQLVLPLNHLNRDGGGLCQRVATAIARSQAA